MSHACNNLKQVFLVNGYYISSSDIWAQDLFILKDAIPREMVFSASSWQKRKREDLPGHSLKALVQKWHTSLLLVVT
jgi:hypothetical protein